MVESLLDKVAGLKAYKFIKKRHRCFPVIFEKILTLILKHISEWLFLTLESYGRGILNALSNINGKPFCKNYCNYN